VRAQAPNGRSSKFHNFHNVLNDSLKVDDSVISLGNLWTRFGKFAEQQVDCISEG
jgi:hypothetical protein